MGNGQLILGVGELSPEDFGRIQVGHVYHVRPGLFGGVDVIREGGIWEVNPIALAKCEQAREVSPP